MRITLDIPDEIHARLKARAKEENTTMRAIILDCVAIRFRSGRAPAKQEGRPRFPAIRSKHPGSLKLGEDGACEDKELDGEAPRKVNRLIEPILKSYAPGSIRLNVEEKPVQKLQLPLIRSSRPGTLELTNEQIDKLTAFS